MAPKRHFARKAKTRAPDIKNLKVNAAMQRGLTDEEGRLSICHCRIFRSDILLHIIRKAGWSNAKFGEHNLKTGEYSFDLGDASRSCRIATDTCTVGNPLESGSKQIATARNPLTPSNRLISSTGERIPLPDAPTTTTPTTTQPIFKIPDLPQRLCKRSILSITISTHKTRGPTMKEMKDYVSTITNLEQHERCDPPLGDCSLTDGNSICWIDGETFLRICDKAMILKAEDLSEVTERMDNYFHGGRLERTGLMDGTHVPPPMVVPSEPTIKVHMYSSLISTYRNASIFINLPVITRELFKGTDPTRCAFRVEKIEDELVVNAVVDGIFEVLAEKAGTSTIHFRVKCWKDSTVRIVGVRVEVMADVELDDEDYEDADVEMCV